MAIRAMGPSGQYETGLDAAGAALPELLAPAGGLDQMLAAIAAGADAIYAGLGGFNARVSAHGFTDDEFARGCAVAHAHGVRVYVTLNVFVFDDELVDAVAAGDTLEIRFYPGVDARPDAPKRWPQVPCPVDAAAGKRIVVHCKRKVDAGCEVYLIRSAGVLDQTAAVLERMRAEADAIAPVERAVEVLPFEGVAVDGGASTELVECAVPTRMVFAWQLMDADPRGELDLSDAVVVLDEVCRASDADWTRSLMQRAGRIVCRNLGQVAIARELGVTFDVAAPVFCANRATLTWLRGFGAGRVYLPAELLGNDAERIAELAAEPGVLGPVDADRPELMVCEHCLLTAEGVCATDATGQVRCRDCLRRRQVRYLVERDGTRLPVAIDACGRTRIFLS